MEMKSLDVPVGKTGTDVNISELRDGEYFLKITSGPHTSVKKFVKTSQ